MKQCASKISYSDSQNKVNCVPTMNPKLTPHEGNITLEILVRVRIKKVADFQNVTTGMEIFMF
jgi:hypothetical protein